MSIPVHSTSTSGWQAKLDLQFASLDTRTYLARRSHIGPLMVQRPFYPEGGVCHCYVIHPPGGVVGGDQLQINVDAGAGAHALITTPAAGKFYRSAGAWARQTQTIRAQQAIVEWLPQENIFFGEAHARIDTRVELDLDSKFLGWEMSCYGRPACDDAFTAGRVTQSFQLLRDSQPLFIDRLHLDGAGPVRHARWGFGGFGVLATLIAFPASDAALQLARTITIESGMLTATRVDDVLVCRCLATHMYVAKDAFMKLWCALRPLLLNREAIAPRVWAT